MMNKQTLKSLPYALLALTLVYSVSNVIERQWDLHTGKGYERSLSGVIERLEPLKAKKVLKRAPNKIIPAREASLATQVAPYISKIRYAELHVPKGVNIK